MKRKNYYKETVIASLGKVILIRYRKLIKNTDTGVNRTAEKKYFHVSAVRVFQKKQSEISAKEQTLEVKR